MIDYNYETDFKLDNELEISNWISKVIGLEGCSEGDISYIFCDDAYLHKLNVEFLNHDTLTDIISFDYSIGKIIQGDIYISVERVAENAGTFGVAFHNELLRVMIHGILHYCGYTDKHETDKANMRAKETHYLNLWG
ncbi:rRNA maturation RNase YbeY [Aestuariivivens sediminis]|uniref:rRNA maturation RNase YbeY n=1 Tax=Aestuariivivens sediminis TaxID=2913557 RepID=UPI001F58D1B6|nr:rRNA maturation RNase YbeY [Aestuariivivens sediminis]